jgi:hypothetical protein
MFLCPNGCVLHFERFCTGEVHCPTVAVIPRQGILGVQGVKDTCLRS